MCVSHDKSFSVSVKAGPSYTGNTIYGGCSRKKEEEKCEFFERGGKEEIGQCHDTAVRALV